MGNRIALVIAWISISCALIWLQFAGEMWALYLFAVILGFGYGGVVALQSPVVAWLFGLKSHGVIFGACIVGYAVGSAIGPVLAGRIFDLADSYRIAFIIFTALAIMAIILAWLLRPTGKETSRENRLD